MSRTSFSQLVVVEAVAKEGHQQEHAESSTCQKKVLGEKKCNNRGKKKFTKILRRRP
jgi:hypothetical protein